jgi:hypothetical protein
MRTPSIRTLAALAYERGEEFDPALTPTPTLMEYLVAASAAAPIASGPGPYERRRRRERERRRALSETPAWLRAEDLLSPPVRLVHGEPV